MTDITTEDGVVVHNGDRVFNYYDRKPGTITTPPDDVGWFIVTHDDGTTTYLNGVYSIAYAQRQGWL